MLADSIDCLRHEPRSPKCTNSVHSLFFLLFLFQIGHSVCQMRSQLTRFWILELINAKWNDKQTLHTFSNWRHTIPQFPVLNCFVFAFHLLGAFNFSILCGKKRRKNWNDKHGFFYIDVTIDARDIDKWLLAVAGWLLAVPFQFISSTFRFQQKQDDAQCLSLLSFIIVTVLCHPSFIDDAIIDRSY